MRVERKEKLSSCSTRLVPSGPKHWGHTTHYFYPPHSRGSKETVALSYQHLHREVYERQLYFYAGEGSQKIILYPLKYYFLAPGLFSKNLFLELAYLFAICQAHESQLYFYARKESQKIIL